MPISAMLRLFSALVLCCSGLGSASALAEMSKHADIVFADSGERELLLDLYLPGPETSDNPPLIVWLHGGIWRYGDKDSVQALAIVDHGFALASIGFRNSDQATFPAQIHDIKAAIRFLRAHAGDYGYDPDAIAVWGYSSGGHLAALTGVSNGNAALEGELGNTPGVSSAVQAIVDYSGPTNLHSILHQSTAHGVSVRAPGMETLLGKPVEDPAIRSLVDLASPALQVGPQSPPLLLMHGVQDNQVPINQAIELQQAYRRAGLHVESEWIVEGTHTSGEFFASPYIEQVADFLHRVL